MGPGNIEMRNRAPVLEKLTRWWRNKDQEQCPERPVTQPGRKGMDTGKAYGPDHRTLSGGKSVLDLEAQPMVCTQVKEVEHSC